MQPEQHDSQSHEPNTGHPAPPVEPQHQPVQPYQRSANPQVAPATAPEHHQPFQPQPAQVQPEPHSFSTHQSAQPSHQQFASPLAQPAQPNVSSLHPQNGGANSSAITSAPAAERVNMLQKFGVVKIAIIVIALLVLGVGGWFAYSFLNKPSTTGSSSSSTGNQAKGYDGIKTVEPLKNGKLNLNPTFDNNTDLRTQTIKAKVSEQVNMSDGNSFAVTKVERNYQGANNIKPYAGKEFVALTIAYGNRRAEDKGAISKGDLKMRDSAGKDELYSLATPLSSTGNFAVEDYDLPPGEQKTGILVFEVNKDEKPLTLVYKQSYIAIGRDDDTRPELVAEISL